MKTYNILLSLIVMVCLASTLQAQNLPDGNLESTELERSEPAMAGDDTKVYITKTDDYYYISIKSVELFVASLCICNDNKVSILHASAALGKIDYKSMEDGTWSSDRTFKWEMREAGFSDEEMSKRRDYLRDNGWVANTMSMGRHGETEYVIKRELLSNNAKIAIGFMTASDPNDTFALPVGKAHACGSLSLVSGDPKKTYSFTPHSWLPL